MSAILLSSHFTLEEFTASDIAARNGIDNMPDEEVIENLKITASGMEEIRDVIKTPIIITSGFRCEEVERILCEKAYKAWCNRLGKQINQQSWKEYFSTKAHPKGFSADWRSPQFGAPKDCCIAVRDSGIKFDQLIYEFESWSHTSFDLRLRQQVLTIDGSGTRQGIA